jgi:hypothetical protein
MCISRDFGEHAPAVSETEAELLIARATCADQLRYIVELEQTIERLRAEIARLRALSSP